MPAGLGRLTSARKRIQLIPQGRPLRSGIRPQPFSEGEVPGPTVAAPKQVAEARWPDSEFRRTLSGERRVRVRGRLSSSLAGPSMRVSTELLPNAMA